MLLFHDKLLGVTGMRLGLAHGSNKAALGILLDRETTRVVYKHDTRQRSKTWGGVSYEFITEASLESPEMPLPPDSEHFRFSAALRYFNGLSQLKCR